jgi:glutamate dehydrogenase
MSSKSSLAQALATRLADALLPGDPQFSKAALASAAEFMLGLAAQRESGDPAILIETISGSASERFMRIGLVNDDMPFLVDSVATTITAHGVAIDRLVHPVLAVRRDAAHKLSAIVEGDAIGEKRESMIYLECPRVSWGAHYAPR